MDKNKFIQQEENILKYWDENDIFQKTLEKKGSFSEEKNYIFYDGPPFATGLPHYGNLVASLMKDVVPRYWTMNGYRVERKWGWDCHGLPVENIAEKELEIKSKKEIEDIGIAKFNEYCRGLVLRYAKEWKDIVHRVGRWADMENDYKTMDANFMESIWWGFSALWEKNLIYEGNKSMHICPRCGTTLSNFEVSLNYQDIKDLSIIAKFELDDEPGTFLLAWTTTPWTLPGNAALAIGEHIEYVKVKTENGNYILAKNNLEKIFESKGHYEIAEQINPQNLIGKKYKPLFDYFIESDLENKNNLYTIQTANFVTVEDGTGIVHIAPAFGEDDMNLGKEKKLPMIKHVGADGKFTGEVKDWAGELVKPREDIQMMDKKIIAHLDKKKLAFSSEEFTHSYPLCWRCDTPLLNYATSSWFVKVVDIKEKMLANNEKMNWVPSHIKHGRFGKWLKNVKDWAVSRERYWGTPIPVWKCEKCGKAMPIKSIEELQNKSLSGCRFYTIRHGEAKNNVNNILSSKIGDGITLTEQGIKEVKEASQKLKDKNIDLIISSDFERAKQTAEILKKELSVEIIYDERLREMNVGDWNGESNENHKDFRKKLKKGELVKYPNGENLLDVKKRVESFYNDLLANHKNKNVLIVGHGDWFAAFENRLANFEKDYLANIETSFANYYKNAEIREHNFVIIDLHKHYVDNLTWRCEECGGEMKRIKEVFDCWFESGSMFYAQCHYPFENKEKFENNFPAQFIAEGVDQTRGWFYTLTVLATALFDNPAAMNVIVNGIVLAEDGQKMAKSKQNYPDPIKIIDKYSVDALRYYLLSSPVMTAESIKFSEQGVKEALQKTVMLLSNILSFYKMYEDKSLLTENIEPKHILDKWIISRMNQTIKNVDKGMKNYNLPDATRPQEMFINDLSTWYLRRSRDRFKSSGEDKKAVLNTMRFVLIEFSKIMAPFMPFISEHLYQELGGKKESVHLENWPEHNEINDEILNKMETARKIVEMGLALRAKENIKVRQALAKLEIKKMELDDEYLNLIKDELNIKKIVLVSAVSEKLSLASDGDLEIGLNIELTPELIKEGTARELVRQINSIRKKNNLTINDKIKIYYQTENSDIAEIIDQMKNQLKKDTLADGIIKEKIDAMTEVKINGKIIVLGLEKLN